MRHSKPATHATDHTVTVATPLPSSHQRPHKIISLWNASNTRNMLISRRNNKHHQLLDMNIINCWVALAYKGSLSAKLLTILVARKVASHLISITLAQSITNGTEKTSDDALRKNQRHTQKKPATRSNQPRSTPHADPPNPP